MRPGETVIEEEWAEVLRREIDANAELLAEIRVALNSAHRTGRAPSDGGPSSLRMAPLGVYTSQQLLTPAPASP